MSDPLLPSGQAHTLLSEEDREGLKLTYITTREEINEAEQANITRAVIRVRRPPPPRLLDDLYLRRLHKRMFGDVWTWAGAYRISETNIGIDWRQVPVAVRDLVRDALVWIEAAEEPDVVAVRFHHRLVQIHPFPNGNGRLSRQAADYLINGIKQDSFSWGANRSEHPEDVRAAYITALREADGGNLDALVAFARS